MSSFNRYIHRLHVETTDQPLRPSTYSGPGHSARPTAQIWFPGKVAKGQNISHPGNFYSTKLQAKLAWWNQPSNNCPPRLLYLLQHGVKVKFIDKPTFKLPPYPPKFINPSDIAFALQALQDSNNTTVKQPTTLRDSQEAPLHFTTIRLHGFFGCRECLLPRCHCGITSQILQQPFRCSSVPQRNIHPAPTRRVLVLDQPKIVTNTIIVHKTAPSPLLLSSYLVVLLLAAAKSPRVWNEVINVVNCALKRAGIRTLLYVDDLLACCGIEAEAFIAREIIAKTLEDAGITNSPTKGQWTPSQVLQDHLDNNVDSKGAGRLQLPEIWRLLDAMGTPTLYPLREQHCGPSVLSSKCGSVESQTAHQKFLAATSTTSSGATSRHRSICLPPTWHLLPQVLLKMKASQANGVVVYPR